MNILELGPGREWIKWETYTDDTIMCVDRMFYDMEVNIEKHPHITLSDDNIFKFLEAHTQQDFDKVIAKRILEHISPEKIGYLLYLIACVTVPGGSIEIVVPDFVKVINDLDRYDPMTDPAQDFNRIMVQAQTEIFNEPSDPHRSIWTSKLAKYYLEIEHYWENITIEGATIDNRDWYLYVNATRT